MNDKEAQAKEAVKAYNQMTGYSAPVEFHFVDNIHLAWWEWADEETKRNTYDLYKDLSNDYGLCTPFDGQAYHLFIRNDRINIYPVVFHEYTHAVDLERFRVEMNEGEIDIELNQYYKALLFFTEFHACIYETEAILVCINQEDQSTLFSKQFPKLVEWGNQLKNRTTTDCDALYYELAHLLAEIRVWQLLGYDISECIVKEFNLTYSVLVNLLENWSKTNYQLLKTAMNIIVELSYKK